MASSLTGLIKKLEWTDFGTPRKSTPPVPGATATAAFTKAEPSFSGVNFNAVPGSKPAEFKLADTVAVSVILHSSRFVNSWVFTHMNKKFQDDLLHHEQGHYDIGALLARDFFVDLMLLKGKTYSSLAAAKADFDAIKKDSIDKQKAVEDLYDLETSRGKLSGPQKTWDGFIQSAFTTPRSSGTTDQSGKPHKMKLVRALRNAGKTI